MLIENDSAAAEMILGTLSAEVNHQSDTVLNKGKGINTGQSKCTGDVDAKRKQFRIEWVRTLAEATDLLNCRKMDVILLNLVLPESTGIDALSPILKVASETIVVVLCTTDQAETAHRAVQNGAADYLLQHQLDGGRLQAHIELLFANKSLEKTGKESEAYFRNISDASPLGILVSDTTGRCIYSNAAYHQISGVACEQVLGTRWSSTIHSDDKQRILADWKKTAQETPPFNSEIRYLRLDQSVVWARLNIAPLYSGKKISGFVQTVEDITERKLKEFCLQEAEEALFEEKERAQVTLNSIGDAVLATDVKGSVSYMNQVAESMTGWSSAEAMGKPLPSVFHIIHGESRDRAPNPVDTVIPEDRIIELSTNCVLIRKDGTELHIEDSAAPIHNREGRVTGAVIVFHDVSVSKVMTLKMSHMAQHDTLTDLPNRVMLTERLDMAIGQASRNHKQLGIMYLDLDLFKYVNDSLGHKIGDLLLQSVAKRLSNNVRTTDTVCRQGGDEFVILLVDLVSSQAAAQIAENLLVAFSCPHDIEGHQIFVTLSIGLSIFPDDGATADAVMLNADLAMYHAKENGRNNYQFFKDEMNQRAARRLFVINGLRRALKHQEFELYYQPKFNLKSGLISGVEALIRWNDPELGLVYPEQFIGIAEESNLIVPIGQWVMVEACRQVKCWLNEGLTVVPVSVNVSAMEFRHKNFLINVVSALKSTDLKPCYLELELTESVLMHHAESSIEVLDALKEMGVSLAIDDFGTGYSSLSYLKRFPINTLKIDKTFVRDVTTDADDATIVSAVIGMGKNLNQKVIAEGIETEQQLAFLKTKHCDEGQGYLFSYPLTAVDFGQFLVSGDVDSKP
ncbi:MAG: EAL domain-containing protein [Amphritea sp.]|nr:EAL domain-containing protein [Amphritea sp.]